MDKQIKKILNKIEENGFEAYIVGGYVRDYLLGKKSYDVDICTNATVKDLREIFNLFNVESEYGSFKFKDSKYNYDITTFRKESNYFKRRPKNVEYVNDLASDLQRRDFTINAICMNKEGEIIDLLKGRWDLQKRLIKCIGSEKDKLREDPLRMLRALRLSASLNFKLDDRLKEEIIKNKKLIKDLTYQRRKEELDKILILSNALESLNFIASLGLLEYLEIEYDDLVATEDLITMYAQIKFSDNYPLTRKDRDLIKKVRLVVKEGISDESLFKYGLYVNVLAGKILNVDVKEINELYNNLKIKDVLDLNMEVKEICNILNIEEGKIIKDVQKELIFNILKGNIDNEYGSIREFLRGNKEKWDFNDGDKKNS